MRRSVIATAIRPAIGNPESLALLTDLETATAWITAPTTAPAKIPMDPPNGPTGMARTEARSRSSGASTLAACRSTFCR